jgi:hypothetical protein
LSRRHEGQVPAQQHGIDVGIAEPLKADEADRSRALERTADCAELDFAALLEIIDATLADAQILHRARLAIAIEPATDITQPNARRHRDGIKWNAIALSHFGADDPTAIVRGRGYVGYCA